MSKSKKKAGMYVQATAATIADGEFRSAIDETVREVFAALEEYEKQSGNQTGKAAGEIKFTVSRNSKEHFNFAFETGVKRPKIKTISLVRAASGRPLVALDPEDDADLNGRRQMNLLTFDRFGNEQATINKETGEILEEDEDADVAGRIAQ